MVAGRKWKIQGLWGLYRVYIDIIGYILGLYRDNGKEDGNYYSILALYWPWVPKPLNRGVCNDRRLGVMAFRRYPIHMG